MAYDPPTSAETAPGKPIRSTHITRLVNAILAVISGDPTAPAISPAALRWKFEDIRYDTVAGGNIAGSNGSFTWTCPTGVTAVLLEAVGSGGGGGGAFLSAATNGSAGGATTFDGDTLANGGAGGAFGTTSAAGAGGAGGSVGVGADWGIAGEDGQTGNFQATSNLLQHGGYGGSSGNPCGFGVGGPNGVEGRVGMPANTLIPPSSSTGYGSGGQGGNQNVGNDGAGGGGGGGSYGRKVRTVLPGTGYSVTVARGGAGGIAAASYPGGAATARPHSSLGGVGNTVGSATGGNSGCGGLLRIWYTY